MATSTLKGNILRIQELQIAYRFVYLRVEVIEWNNGKISEANAFCSATTKYSVRKKNFNFLLYNLIHD